MRRGLAGLVGAAIAAIALPASASAEVFCDYIDAEPAGPAGNVLAVTATGQFDLFEPELEGEEDEEEDENIFEQGVRVSPRPDGTISVLAPGREPVTCAGGQPTLTNIDELRVVSDGSTFAVLDLVTTSFAPGVTDEGDGSSEIEIRMAGGYAGLYILGGPGSDRYTVTRPNREERFTANLNPGADGDHKDPDINAGEYNGLGFIGGDGNDRFVVEPPARRSEPEDDGLDFDEEEFEAFVYMVGGPGNDSLIGGWAPYAEQLGGRGNDVIRGGHESDDLGGGVGNDVLYAGPDGSNLQGGDGRDRLFGANGDDQLDGGGGRDHLIARGGEDAIRAKDGKRDTIDCGPGHDRVFGSDDSDRKRNCEGRPRRRNQLPLGIPAEVFEELEAAGEL
jgi:Ca2+-binding RTX toxin-like protein